MLVDVFDAHHSRRVNDGTHQIKLEPYAWRWYRVGSIDNTLHLSDLAMADEQIR